MLRKQLCFSASIFFFLLCFPFSLSNSDFSSLLAFKQSSDPFHSLSSWVNSSDPCQDSWFGVTCDPTTRRVTRLFLENMNLSGSVQPLTRLADLRILRLKHNGLSFSPPSFNLSSWPNLRQLYLSHNHLVGEFPAGISSLRRLRRLDLSHNRLSGEIPLAKLIQLPRLLSLRLEANSLSGILDSVDPPSVSMLEFNVSYNKLRGEIPSWLSHYPASSFVGNRKLCGDPLQHHCSNWTVEATPRQSRVSDDNTTNKTKKLCDWVVVLIIIVDAVLILAALAAITYCFYKGKCCFTGSQSAEEWRSQGHCERHSGATEGVKKGMVVFEGCKGFTRVGDLLKCSAELLGKGTVGATYKVLMDDGDAVAVKRTRLIRKIRKLDGWLKMIGGLRHRNIVSLKAYCNSLDELLLVYDFLPNGSLFSLLHETRGPGRTPLEWATRLNFASGAACGLAFLHSYSKPMVCHGNLKSSNIIIDRSGNACVSDIGLHQLLHEPSSPSSAYKAPELLPNDNSGSSRKYTHKCDVYSFGVILLEILTGKMMTEDEETHFVRWVQNLRREEWSWEVFDVEMWRVDDKEMEEEMVTLLQVALLCLAPLPKDRPKMSVVHRVIEGIRTKGANGGGSVSFLNGRSSDCSMCLSETPMDSF